MSRKQYARGRNAIAECQRSGQKMRYRDLVEDGHISGLLVHPDWWEPKHPQEIPVEVDDPIALYRPAPEISIEDGYGNPEALDGRDVLPRDEWEALASIYDDFNRPGPEIGEIWERSPFDEYPDSIIYEGSWIEDPPWPPSPSYRSWSDNLHQKVLPANQFVMVEYINFRNTLGSYYGNHWVWLKGTNGDGTADAALETLNGVYFYVGVLPTGPNTLNGAFTTFEEGNVITFFTDDTITIPGVLPDGMRLRCQVVDDVYSAYYDLGDGNGWQEWAAPTFNDTFRGLGGKVGVGLEGWDDDNATGITNFWAGEVTGTQGLIGSLGGTLAVTDDFNRAALGPSWATGLYPTFGGLDFSIVANQLVSQPDGYALTVYLDQKFDQDCFIEADFTGIPTAADYWEITFYLRGDTSEANQIVWGGLWGDPVTSNELGIYIGGRENSVQFPDILIYPISTLSSSVSATAKFRVEAVGDTVSIYLDDQLIVSHSDPNFSRIARSQAPTGGGEVSIQLYRTTGDLMPLDNFRAGSMNTIGGSLIGGEALTKDDFNRADAATAGVNWVKGRPTSTQAPIVSNQLSGLAVQTWDNRIEHFSHNQYAEVQVFGLTTSPALSYFGFQMRQNSVDDDRLMTWVDHDPIADTFYWYFGRKVGGVATYDGPDGTIQNASSFAEGLTIRTEIADKLLTFYINDVEIYRTTKAGLLDGLDIENFIGVAFGPTNDGDIQLDNFRAGHIATNNEVFQQAFTGTLELNLTGGERSVAISEAVMHEFNAWLTIDLDDGTQFSTRIATGSDSPTFLLPLTTAFPAGKIASAGNYFYIGAA